MNPAENYTYRYLETDDLDQYNALLRYTFQVTEDELTATGWKDDEIKQSKFPVLERADVLGCFDGENLVSQFAVYPLKMNIYDAVYHVGFVTSVCTYPEYTGNGIMKRLMIQGLTQMHKEGKSFALLYPYSIPLYHHLGWEIISNKISYNIKDRQIHRDHRSVEQLFGDGAQLAAALLQLLEQLCAQLPLAACDNDFHTNVPFLMLSSAACRRPRSSDAGRRGSCRSARRFPARCRGRSSRT